MPSSPVNTLNGSLIDQSNSAYVEVAVDDCQRPDENPLEPQKWELFVGSEADGLALRSKKISAAMAGGNQTGFELLVVPPSFSPDQWIEAVLGPIRSPNAQVIIHVRTSKSFNQFIEYQTAPTGFVGPTFTEVVALSDEGGNSTILFSQVIPTPVPGDLVRLEVKGSLIRALRNGVLVVAVEIPAQFVINSGQPAVQINTNNQTNDCYVTFVRAGEIHDPSSQTEPSGEVQVTDFQSIPRVIVPKAQFTSSATTDLSQKYSKTDWK